MAYGPNLVGKRLFRVRETHVAEHLVALIRGRAVGAAKLDLVLRGIALQPVHAGRRETGLVLPRYTWEWLHDAVRGTASLGGTAPDIDASSEVVRLKRKWVGEQLNRLERLRLVERTAVAGKRPKLVVLRDDGSGQPLDDPDGSNGNTYVSILGAVVGSEAFRMWGAAELSAFLAAMVAERHDSSPLTATRPIGGGQWFRPLGWFADREGRFGPPARVKIGFSDATLERGVSRLETSGLISRARIFTAPGTNRRLNGPRTLYTNNFAGLDSATDDAEDADD